MAINDREQCLIDRKENKESETPAAIWRLWCPLCWLVPSEWVRSVTGFWTHSSFKRRTNKPQTFAMGKGNKAETEINVYKKIVKNKNQKESAWRHNTSEEKKGRESQETSAQTGGLVEFKSSEVTLVRSSPGSTESQSVYWWQASPWRRAWN